MTFSIRFFVCVSTHNKPVNSKCCTSNNDKVHSANTCVMFDDSAATGTHAHRENIIVNNANHSLEWLDHCQSDYCFIKNVPQLRCVSFIPWMRMLLPPSPRHIAVYLHRVPSAHRARTICICESRRGQNIINIASHVIRNHKTKPKKLIKKKRTSNGRINPIINLWMTLPHWVQNTYDFE